MIQQTAFKKATKGSASIMYNGQEGSDRLGLGLGFRPTLIGYAVSRSTSYNEATLEK